MLMKLKLKAMKKKLYYTVEKEIEDNEFLTGLKTVTVYEIINNEPKEFFSLDLSLDDNSKKEIQDYLDDNGYGDDEFEFILL
jgi:hypothetical protein